MKFSRDVVGAIGRTPLIKLRAASEMTGCTILGKAEFMNPGGSVKDRAALAIISSPTGRTAAANRARIAASASQPPNRARGLKHRSPPTTAAANSNVIGEAIIQKIFEATKNIGDALS